jgi:hypothetical protein
MPQPFQSPIIDDEALIALQPVFLSFAKKSLAVAVKATADFKPTSPSSRWLNEKGFGLLDPARTYWIQVAGWVRQNAELLASTAEVELISSKFSSPLEISDRPPADFFMDTIANTSWTHALASWLAGAIEFYGTETLSDEMLLESLARFLAFWKHTETHSLIFLAVQGLTGEVKEVTFTEFRLVPADSSRVSLVNRAILPYRHGPLEIARVGALLLAEHKQAGPSLSTTSEAHVAEAVDILSSLRLLQGGNIGYLGGTIEQVFINNLLGGSGSSGVPDSICYFPNFDLRVTEIPRLIEIYETIRHIPQDKSFAPLRFAIRRFNSSYGKLRHEDRLLDCTIALESLLVSDDRDLSLQFRLYGALILEPQRKRATTYGFLKTLYGYRSKIVHEGRDIPGLLKASADSGVSFLEETLQITREVIIAFLRCSGKGEPPAKVRRRIEGQLLSPKDAE